MKIHYYAGSTIPSTSANSVQVMNMCGAFSDLGHDVTLFCRTDSDQSNESCFSKYGIESRRRFDLERFPTHQFPVGRTLPFYINRIVQRLMGSLPDLIFGRHPRSMLPFIHTPVPMIYEAHELPSKPKNRFAERVLFSASNFRSLVVVSNQLKKGYIRRRLIPHSSKVMVAHNAVSPPEAIEQSIELKGNESFHAGYVGSLSDRKGFPLIPELARDMNEIGFHVIGGSPEEVSNWKQSFDDVENLHMYGYCPQKIAFRYMRSMDVLLAPYAPLPDREHWYDTDLPWMCPLKNLEYMSVGKPILSSALPTIKEVLTHRKNAILVEPGSLDQLKQGLHLLREDETLRKRIAKQAKDDWASKHTLKHRAERVLQKPSGR